MRLEIHPDNPQQRKVDQAVEIMRRGGVVVYPTDTVYGLGCDFTNKKAVERIYQIKQMKKDHLVSFICGDLSDITQFAQVDDRAYRVMRRLLPGPYTFILRATKKSPKFLQMKRKTVGIRIPDNKVALALVKTLGNPIVSTSASLGGVQENDPDEVARSFEKLVDVVIDSSWCGLEPSTIVDLSGSDVEIVREGAGPVDAI